MIAPIGVGRQNISLGIACGERADELLGTMMSFVVRHRMLKRRPNVNAFTAGELGPGSKALGLHNVTQA